MSLFLYIFAKFHHYSPGPYFLYLFNNFPLINVFFLQYNILLENNPAPSSGLPWCILVNSLILDVKIHTHFL